MRDERVEMKRLSVWKLVGLAGVAGVAATGVAVARAERKRRALSADDVRARLHERWASLDAASEVESEAIPAPETRSRSPLGRLRAWRRRRAGRRRHG